MAKLQELKAKAERKAAEKLAAEAAAVAEAERLASLTPRTLAREAADAQRAEAEAKAAAEAKVAADGIAKSTADAKAAGVPSTPPPRGSMVDEDGNLNPKWRRLAPTGKQESPPQSPPPPEAPSPATSSPPPPAKDTETAAVAGALQEKLTAAQNEMERMRQEQYKKTRESSSREQEHAQRHLEAAGRQESLEGQVSDLKARFNQMVLLHPDAAQTMEAAEKRASAKAMGEMLVLRERHREEVDALRAANEAIRKVAARLSEAEGGTGGGEGPGEKKEGGALVAPDATNMKQLAGLLGRVDECFAEQEIILASAIAILRATRREEVPSQAGSWFAGFVPKFANAYAGGKPKPAAE